MHVLKRTLVQQPHSFKMTTLPPPPPRLELAPPTTKTLPTCSPNLMPFHIAYSGDAPVSTYFRVKEAPPPSYLGETTKGLKAMTISREDTVPAMDTGAPSLGGNLSQSATPTLSEAPSMTETESQQTLVASSTASTALSSRTDISSATRAVDEEGDTRMDTSEDPASTLVTPSGDVGQHYIATFRGRTVRGLRVALPEGYAGVILEAPDVGKVDAKGKGRAVDTEQPTSKAKARGRARNSGKGRKSKRGAEEEEKELHEADEHEHDVSLAPELAGEDSGPVRTLQAASTFSSFVLWNPDIPVNENKDEYMRTLKEWVGLASVVSVHSTMKAGNLTTVSQIHSYD